VVVVLVVAAAAVLVAARTLAEAVSAELLNLEVGFTRRVRAELLELERAEAELDSVWVGTRHIGQRRHHRFALPPPADR